jgi:hypothetical protein
MVLVVLVALGGDPFSMAASASGSTAPTEGALFGAWVKQRNTDTHYESVVAFEQLIGRKLAISHHYRSWDNNYWGEEALDVAAGRYPLVTWGDWGKTPARDIAAGRHDGLIRGKADAIRALGGTVMVRWAPEMAGGSYGTASEYISAWRHIHGIFRDRGATNVEWVWCPTAFSFRNGTAPAFYPGDAYVDWICADGYNWYPAQGEWKTFADIFRWFYEWGSQRDKPLMIGETGVMEDPAMPGRKAGWFDQVVPALKAMPKVKAFVYFHARSPKGYEFWADTSSGALTAFKRMASDAYLDGEGAPVDPPVSSSPTPQPSPTPTSSPGTSESPCTIVGTSGADVIEGTMGADVICAGSGSDVVRAYGGDDVVYGGDGNDTLNAGAGADVVYAGEGNDTVYGILGDDTEYGEAGDDFIGGGDGSDRQDGGPGEDRCDQGAGSGPQTSCEHVM